MFENLGAKAVDAASKDISDERETYVSGLWGLYRRLHEIRGAAYASSLLDGRL